MARVDDLKARLDVLIENGTRLTEDEIEIVVTIAERLAHGQSVYGPLYVQRDTRDYSREAFEEFIDGAVYLAARALRHSRDTDPAPPPESERGIGGRLPSATFAVDPEAFGD